jgi:hypothetical protein
MNNYLYGIYGIIMIASIIAYAIVFIKNVKSDQIKCLKCYTIVPESKATLGYCDDCLRNHANNWHSPVTDEVYERMELLPNTILFLMDLTEDPDGSKYEEFSDDYRRFLSFEKLRHNRFPRKYNKAELVPWDRRCYHGEMREMPY